MSGSKFSLGSVVATPGVLEAFGASGESPLAFLERHLAGDWGDVDEHDRNENELSLQNGLRILSAYTLSTGVKFWIITEADRSATTFLLPDEY
jgi:hypothetical protein